MTAAICIRMEDWLDRHAEAEAALWSAGYLAPCLLSEGVWFGIHFGHARNYVR